MSDAPLDTLRMRHCIERWQAGDPQGIDDLLRTLCQRLEHITRKMLRGFPAVRANMETSDVLQSSLLRLLNALRQIQANSTRHFLSLAAVNIRRELLDLARRFKGQALVCSTTPGSDSGVDASPIQAAAAPGEDADLDLWRRFHEAVESLPAEEREVVGLVFYHGWTQAQIGDLFQVDERTIRRRWQSACLRLHQLVGLKLPQP
jgi:RNA polymerase sigma factor (sigma-70 family)